METPPAANVSTIDRVIQTYLFLSSEKHPVGVTEIADSLKVSKTVVHRILQHLVRYGMAEHNSKTRKYALGPRSYVIASNLHSHDILNSVSGPYMEYLFELTGETVTLCRRFGFHNVYIRQIESIREIHITVPLGENVPLTVGSNGLCELAFMEKESIDLALSLPRKKITSQTVTDEGTIRQRLKQIKANGYSFTSGERVPFSAALSVPLLVGPPIQPVGAISVAFLDSRFPEIQESHIIDEIQHVAHLIESKLSSELSIS